MNQLERLSWAMPHSGLKPKNENDPKVEYDLRKTPFNRRLPLTEDDPWQKTTGKITLYTRNFHFRTEFTKACIIIYHNSSSKCEASYYYWIIIAWNDESLSSAVIPSDLWIRNCFITCYSCFGWWKLNTCSQSYSGTAQFILKKNFISKSNNYIKKT